MGTEYSAVIGYGFVLLGDPPQGWSHEQWYDGDVDKWLWDTGRTSLESVTGGNSMSGPKAWGVFVRGTTLSMDPKEDWPVLSIAKEPSAAEVSQVASLARLWDAAGYGWRVMCNVF